MKIGRKEAILAFIAAVIPFVGRRANAQVQRLPTGSLTGVKTLAPQVSPEVADLQKRVAALEAQLVNMVGFTRDAYGNLSIQGTRDVKIDAGANFTVKAVSNVSVRASGTADLWGSATTTIRGSTISLN